MSAVGAASGLFANTSKRWAAAIVESCCDDFHREAYIRFEAQPPRDETLCSHLG